jgi:hypothetical protein
MAYEPFPAINSDATATTVVSPHETLSKTLTDNAIF